MNSIPAIRCLSAFLALALGACSAKHDDRHRDDGAHAHTHDAKHGGIAVELGNEEFHVEFTYGDKSGVLQAYILDAHMENYVRIETHSFPASAVIDGNPHALIFTATSSAATGEKPGDSSLFEAPLPPVTGQPALQLSVPTLMVKGRTYTNVSATLPAR